jgi:hypothetical protein
MRCREKQQFNMVINAWVTGQFKNWYRATQEGENMFFKESPS